MKTFIVVRVAQLADLRDTSSMFLRSHMVHMIWPTPTLLRYFFKALEIYTKERNENLT